MIEEGVIDDVRAQLLSGKEASVFVVERDGELYAAKVYKAREGRSFKNVTSYVEGRNQTRNSRNKRAMTRKTRYGQKLVEDNWRATEQIALQRAFNAGVRVPEPYLLYEEVLLMELVCDETGTPAPRLSDFELTKEVAGLLHLEAFLQVRRLLAAGMIHGDLSAFNILVASEGLTLIDMPQLIDASANSEAAELLQRDLKNLTEHLARVDPGLLRFRDCGEALWNHYQRGTLEQVREPEAGREHRRGRRRRQGQGKQGQGKQGQGKQGQDKQGQGKQGQGRGPKPEQGQPQGQPKQSGDKRPPRAGPKRGGPASDERKPRGESETRRGRPKAPEVERVQRRAVGPKAPASANKPGGSTADAPPPRRRRPRRKR
jgi:RIO kinase 1